MLFTENESNASRLWGQPNPSPYVKDAFHEYVISGKREAVNPSRTGTKAAAHYCLEVFARRLSSIFRRDTNGKRPVYGGTKKFQEDPHWRDYILFYEYFHGDNGAGLGASHQTGWTGIIARSLDLFARLQPANALQISKGELLARMTRKQVAGSGATTLAGARQIMGTAGNISLSST